MALFILRRLIQSLFVLLAVSVVVFFAVYAVGDPIELLVSPEASQAAREAMIARLGLDLPAETDSVARANGLIAIRASEGRAELWVPIEQGESLTQQLKALLAEADLNQ